MKHELLLEHAGERSPAARAVMAVLQTAQLIDRACAARLAPHALSEGRLAVLLAAARRGTATPAQLAEDLGVTRAAITGLCDSLARAELITRAPHPSDRRSLTIALTPAGDRVLERLRPEYGVWLAELAEALDPADLTSALRALGSLQARLEQQLAAPSEARA